MNPKKTRKLNVYGTQGSMVFDMLDEAATIRLCTYSENGDSGYIVDKQSSWKFNEKNNLNKILKVFYESIHKGNFENKYISEKVNEILHLLYK